MRWIVVAIATAALAAAAGGCNRCEDGYTDTGGRCILPDGSAAGGCAGAPIGLYVGQTDQGLPIAFEVATDQASVTNFAIRTQLLGPGSLTATHEIHYDPGFPLLGCGFGGIIIGGQFGGQFSAPSSFTGEWADSVEHVGTEVVFSAGGTWTASFVGDGGTNPFDVDAGVPSEDGGAEDGGAEDGGAVDGGAADGGATDGGAGGEISVPEGFTVDVVAENLQGPIALALDPASGDLFVAEHFGGSITRITSTGGRTKIATGLTQPRGLAYLPDQLYVTEELQISVVAPSGGSDPSAFGDLLAFSPGPLVCDETPSCTVSEFSFGQRHQSIWRVTASDATLVAGTAQGIDQPFGVAPAGDGVLVAEANLGYPSADGVLFHLVDADGGVSGMTPLPLIAQPGSLAPISADLYAVGEVVLGSGGGRKVFLLDSSGPSTRAFAHGFALPIALAYDGVAGALYVADLSRGGIFRIRGPFEAL